MSEKDSTRNSISSEETLNWIWISYLKWTPQIWKISFQLWRISSRRPIDFKIRIALFIYFILFFPIINSFLLFFLPLIISSATYKLSSRYVFSCVICFRFIHFILLSTAHALFLTCLPVSIYGTQTRLQRAICKSC